MTAPRRIIRIGLGSALKTGFVVSAAGGCILGVLLGGFLAFFSSIMGALFPLDTAGLGLAAVLLTPIVLAGLCGVTGAALSFLAALLYNITSGLFGGIEVVLDRDEKPVYRERPSENEHAG